MPRPRTILEPSRITVTFDRDDYESVRAIAAEQQGTNSAVVRQAVREWLGSAQRRARRCEGERIKRTLR